MKIYISGPIKGFEDVYRELFAQAEKDAKDLWRGASIYNPVTIGDALTETLGRTPTYEEFMLQDIRMLLSCQLIWMMSGWGRSAGARCEHHVAMLCGIAAHYE